MIVPAIDKVQFLRASVDISSSGANVVIPGVAGKIVKIHALFLIAAGDVDITLKQDVSGSKLTGAMSTGVKGNGFVLPPSEVSYFKTSLNNGLNINLSGAVQVSGSVLYIQE